MKQWLADVNGVRYQVAVSGRGPALLLLHGFTGSGANYDDYRAGLVDTATVITVDLLGHGQTDSPADPARYAMSQAAADLIATLDRLWQGRVWLAGYSMGGRLALYTALTYPQRFAGLLLESASPGLADADERAARAQADNALAAFIEREGIAAFVERWEALPLFATQARLPEAVRTRLREQRLRNNPAGLANSLRGMGTGVQPSLWEALGGLAMPVVLVTGAQDVKFTRIAAQMLARLPQAQHSIVPEAGHTVHLEQPEGYLRLLRAWLATGV